MSWNTIRRTHREQHVFLVLVDGSGVGDSVGVLDHADGLTCATDFSEAAALRASAIIFFFFLLACTCACVVPRLPVRMDWSTRSVVDLMEMILMSAGTLSPTSVHTQTETVLS